MSQSALSAPKVITSGEAAGVGERGVVEPAQPRARLLGPGWTASGWLLAALAAVLVLALTGALTLVALGRRADAVEQARGQALRAASAGAARILSYDYRHLDADFAAGRALTTGAIADQYASTTGDAVAKLAAQTKATVVAQVAAAGLQRASADQVVVLLFVNQTTTSNRLERPQVDQNRVEMTMVKKQGRWLISQVRGL
jgi:Mce-associated membrane protein